MTTDGTPTAKGPQGEALQQDPGAATPGLAEARAGIDAIDDQIHDLLMERARHVRFIGSTKRGGGGAYRPAREARILRRLFDRNQRELDFAIVYRLWREMIGGFTAMQSPLRVGIVEGSGLARLARDHFGAAATVGAHPDGESLRAAMQTDPSLLAIVGPQDWSLCLGDGAAKIVAALPVYGAGENGIAGYCLASAVPEDSGEDVTLFAVTGDAPQGDFDCISHSGTHCLIAVPGFHAEDAPMRQRIAESGDVEPDAVTCIGAYPVPIGSAAP